MPRVIASWFGSGLILRKIRGSDIGSGTVGSIITFPIAIGIGVIWGWPAQTALLVMVLGVGTWAVYRLPDEGDAGWIVVDEAAGTILATIGLGWWAGLVALVVFRLADILKTTFPGVARADSWPGAAGVMADDLLAGIYGLAAGLVVNAFL